MNRYFEIGGFPEVQHFSDEIRQLTLQSYLDSVILKDVVERHNVTNVTALRYLINSLINATGQRFSLNKFYNTLKSLGIKCSKDNLYDFVEYLAEAYLLFRLPLLTDSERVRQVNPDKIYIIDLGLIKSVARNSDKNHGACLENLVYLHLRRLRYDLAYINTSSGYEVDFHVSKRGSSRKMLVQVCYNPGDEVTLERELRAVGQAGESLGIKEKYIVTWDSEREFDRNIKAIPIWKFLLQSFD
jgi:predicted AAA+ superfamily ATPase